MLFFKNNQKHAKKKLYIDDSETNRTKFLQILIFKTNLRQYNGVII